MSHSAATSDRYVLSDAQIATMTAPEGYGLIERGHIAVEGGVIAHVGADLRPDYADWPRESLGGALVTPSLIDCHTHIVFGGNRAREFEMRLQGATYEEVARAGGGIVSTMAATRDATQEQLFDAALACVRRFEAQPSQF